MNSKILPDNVEVLLATYNGEIFLAELLDSLLAQVDVRISLLVSDDGSQDKTLQILDSYKDKFASYKFLKGPQKGPQANFFFLLSQSTGTYVALCDQDDIWEKNHLKNSVVRLRAVGPSVTFSTVTEFPSGVSKPTRIWPEKVRIKRIENILFVNQVRGCTIVMNRSFVEIILRKLPEHAIMHDWWIALVGMSYNCLTFTKIPEVKYRLHLNNVLGGSASTNTRLKRLVKIIRSGSFDTIEQIRDLSLIHAHQMTDQLLDSISIWTQPISLYSLRKQVFVGARYRSKVTEEVVLRCLFIWVWLIKSRKK